MDEGQPRHKLDFYRAVLEWFLAAENITFRALLLPDKQRLYAALPEERRDFLYYRLYYPLLPVPARRD